MLFDTDVLIWVFRGNLSAARTVESADERAVSVVSYMELLQGSRNAEETKAIKAFLSEFDFEVLPLTENIGHRASIYMEEYVLKYGMCVADALLAATAVENGLVFCTGNAKHYKPVRDLSLKVFRP